MKKTNKEQFLTVVIQMKQHENPKGFYVKITHSRFRIIEALNLLLPNLNLFF